MERRTAGAAEPIAHESAHFVSAASLRVRSDWFNRMRWSAASGLVLVSLLAVSLAASRCRWRRSWPPSASCWP